MSSGLTALDRKDHATARDAFAEARDLRPGSSEPVDGLVRAEAGLRRAAIEAHRQQAAAFEAQEAWRDALESYNAVLAIDTTVRFAQEGEERTRERAELAEQLAFHIERPERLSTEAVLREASVIADRAASIEPAGPRHQRQTAELRRLVEMFSTPVRARLRSDNQTEVLVYKVGRLGVFDERALDLRPGTYTVVGTRRGYRDVRRKLVIKPGEEPKPLLVRCEERI